MRLAQKEFAKVISCAVGVAICLAGAYVVAADVREFLDKIGDRGKSR